MKDLKFAKQATDKWTTEVTQSGEAAYAARIGKFAGSPAARRYYWISTVYGRRQNEGYAPTLAEAKAAIQADWASIADAFQGV